MSKLVKQKVGIDMNEELKGLFEFLHEELCEMGYSLDCVFVCARELKDKPITVDSKPFVSFCLRKE